MFFQFTSLEIVSNLNDSLQFWKYSHSNCTCNQLECVEIVSSSNSNNNNNSHTIPIYLFHRWIHTCSVFSLSLNASNAADVMYMERFSFLYCEPGSMPDLTNSTADIPSDDISHCQMFLFSSHSHIGFM